MPERKYIKKILVIGAGTVVIGQEDEYDAYGTQACQTLREMGYQIIVVNSNPAAVMTRPELADATYIEPLNTETLVKIIEREHPDAILPTVGGLPAFALCVNLYHSGIFAKFNLKLLGPDILTIQSCEDRHTFKETMGKMGIDVTKGKNVHSVEEAEAVAIELGYPVVLYNSFLAGGRGSGIAYNVEELREIAGRGLAASISGNIFVEEAAGDRAKFEVQVMRDSKNRTITAGIGEFIDSAEIHEGDSILTIPAVTINKSLGKILFASAYRIVEQFNITGITSVLFSYDRNTGRIYVHRITPAFSHSASFFSRATGIPLVSLSTYLALGLNLDEFIIGKNKTLESFVPADGYAAVRLPCWDLARFPGALDRLGPQMRSFGEVMGVGKNYKEALQKAIRSLGDAAADSIAEISRKTSDELMMMLNYPSSMRTYIIFEELRRGTGVQELSVKTHINPWFIQQMRDLMETESTILQYKGKRLPDSVLIRAKKDGFTDKFLAEISHVREVEIRRRRYDRGIIPKTEYIHSGVSDERQYCYMTYDSKDAGIIAEKKDRKILVLGGGPHVIGQGSEVDCSCLEAVDILIKAGYKVDFVDCNPGTGSLVYNILLNKSYIAPLTPEDIVDICRSENAEGIIVQFGGCASLAVAPSLEEDGINVLGTTKNNLNIVFNIESLNSFLTNLKIPVLKSVTVDNREKLTTSAAKVGYPLFAISGGYPGNSITDTMHDEEELRTLLDKYDLTPEHPLILQSYPEQGISAEVDCLTDGQDVFIPAITGHIEHAVIHSGDAAAVLPPLNINPEYISIMKDYAGTLARSIGTVGLLNIRFVVHEKKVYVTKVLPYTSRNIPLLTKITGVPLAGLAAEIIAGKKLKDLPLAEKAIPFIAVKESVFSFDMFPEIDPVLGPRMKSTGEVLGIASSFGLAYWKAQEAINPLPAEGTVLITVARQDWEAVIDIAAKFTALGFKIRATAGTQVFLEKYGIQAEPIFKQHEGRPNITDAIKNKQIQLVINTPADKQSKYDDSYIRKAAVKYRVPYITTLTGAMAAAAGIEAFRKTGYEVKTLQSYYQF